VNVELSGAIDVLLGQVALGFDQQGLNVHDFPPMRLPCFSVL
jgi:hypothetical protein